MAKPFANAPQHNGAITDNYIVGLQIGRSIDDAGLQQMKYITIRQLKTAVTETLSAVFTFRGVYSSTVPDTPAVNDYFYCNAQFTDATQDIDDGTGTYSHTFYANKLYAWNGVCWADITSLLPGNGIPAGGTTGQVLKKASGTDYDVEWSSDADLDTKNTAGATDSSQKLYIVGAPEQTANPQTYTQDTAYVGTDGAVYSEGKKTLTQVSGVTLGNVPKFDANGNIVDSNIAAADVLTESDVVNSVLSQSTDKPLSANMGYELQQEIDNLKARGRFLSLWNCTTGLPATNPQEMPYTYKAGDYYIVSSVGTTNYRPNGTTYSGTASSTQETLEVKSNDFYEYDGTNWILLFNTQKTVTFANIAGQPSDNQNLASALGGKVNTSDVYNALDQTAAGKVLDARQGKALNDAISDISDDINAISSKYVGLSKTVDNGVVPSTSISFSSVPKSGVALFISFGYEPPLNSTGYARIYLLAWENNSTIGYRLITGADFISSISISGNTITINCTNNTYRINKLLIISDRYSN